MTSNVPDCPICTFPVLTSSVSMHSITGPMGGSYFCRSCGYVEPINERSKSVDDNRYENSIFEMPRDEFMKALEERYNDGYTKGFLLGMITCSVVALIVVVVTTLSILKLTDDILGKAQQRNRMMFPAEAK